MKQLDYSAKMQQVTPTIDYTEVVHLVDQNVYVVVWHDNIVFESNDKEIAVKEYYRIIKRVPASGKSSIFVFMGFGLPKHGIKKFIVTNDSGICDEYYVRFYDLSDGVFADGIIDFDYTTPQLINHNLDPFLAWDMMTNLNSILISETEDDAE